MKYKRQEKVLHASGREHLVNMMKQAAFLLFIFCHRIRAVYSLRFAAAAWPVDPCSRLLALRATLRIFGYKHTQINAPEPGRRR